MRTQERDQWTNVMMMMASLHCGLGWLSISLFVALLFRSCRISIYRSWVVWGLFLVGFGDVMSFWALWKRGSNPAHGGELGVGRRCDPTTGREEGETMIGNPVPGAQLGAGWDCCERLHQNHQNFWSAWRKWLQSKIQPIWFSESHLS